MVVFFHRVVPTGEELETMIRVGGFDEFGETRTRKFCGLSLRVLRAGPPRKICGDFAQKRIPAKSHKR